MVYNEGDPDCVEGLKKPANKVLRTGKDLRYDPYEKRVGLWNEIQENYEKYMDEECGNFLKDLDNHFRSQFEVSLLILALCFKENDEDFKPAERFNELEFEVYNQIEKYNVFEILSIDDIKKRVVSEDKQLLDLFRDYYVYMDKWVENTLNDSSLRLPVRFYLKNRWSNYKENINKAISNLITELDWFRKLIGQWESEAEEMTRDRVMKASANIRKEAKLEAEQAVEEEKKEVEEKAREVEEKETEIKTKEDEIKKVMEELRGAKEKVEKGSRYLNSARAKQYELNFVGRIERKLGNEVELSGKSFKVEEVKESFEIDVSGFIGAQSNFGMLTEKEVKNLPENRYIEANLTEKKLIGGKEKYSLKAIFTSRVKEYAEYGFDTNPLDLSEVNVYMTSMKDEARKKDIPMLLCLASPTGFEEAVKDHVNSEEFHRNFLSNYLSVCLVDLETGELGYNPHDDIAKEFAKLCEIELDNEKMAKVERCVEGMMDGKDWVTLKEALECGEESIVKPVFYDLADRKGWKVKFIENVGLVLMK